MGMLYVGNALPGISPYVKVDHCLINPQLEIDRVYFSL